MQSTATRLRATVVVPTWNEAANIQELIRHLWEALPDAGVLVIDDSSADGTAERARALAGNGLVRVIERRGETGLSSAVVRGIRQADADVCLVMDADFSHPPGAAAALVAAVEEGADIAVGSRYCPGGDIDSWPALRRLASRAGTWLARPLTGVADPMAGFFCLHKRLLEGVELRPRGFKILLEILARAAPRRVVEIPIRFEDRRGGTSKFGPKQRREYLVQVASLYRDLNAWPWRLAKFLFTGGLGSLLHLAVLVLAVEAAGLPPAAGAAAGFAIALHFNYAVNRRWTFRAAGTPLIRSWLRYVVGAAAGFTVQLGVMAAFSSVHYALAAMTGIAAGTAATFLCAQAWAFARR